LSCFLRASFMCPYLVQVLQIAQQLCVKRLGSLTVKHPESA
jgi:hypothetical protein